MNTTEHLKNRAGACLQLAQTCARQGNLNKAREFKNEAVKLAAIAAKIERGAL